MQTDEVVGVALGHLAGQHLLARELVEALRVGLGRQVLVGDEGVDLLLGAERREQRCLELFLGDQLVGRLERDLLFPELIANVRGREVLLVGENQSDDQQQQAEDDSAGAEQDVECSTLHDCGFPPCDRSFGSVTLLMVF